MKMEFQHKDLAGRWAQMSLAEQMLNIGSEVSRANRWRSIRATELAAFFMPTINSLFKK